MGASITGGGIHYFCSSEKLHLSVRVRRHFFTEPRSCKTFCHPIRFSIPRQNGIPDIRIYEKPKNGGAKIDDVG